MKDKPIIPILIGIKQDTKALLTALAGGVSHFFGDRSQKKQDQAAERKVEDQNADIFVTVKLEPAGQSTFTEPQKRRIRRNRNTQPVAVDTPIAMAELNQQGQAIDSSPIQQQPTDQTAVKAAAKNNVNPSRSAEKRSTPITTDVAGSTPAAPPAVIEETAAPHPRPSAKSAAPVTMTDAATPSEMVHRPRRSSKKIQEPVTEADAAMTPPHAAQPVALPGPIFHTRPSKKKYSSQIEKPVTVSAEKPAVKKAERKAVMPPVKKQADADVKLPAKKRDASGRFKKSDDETKSQQAHRDRKQNEKSVSGQDGFDKAETLLSKLIGAGAEVAKNTDAKEAVGLATLGPVTGAISEMASLGGSIKDTVAGVIDKFRGDERDKKSGDKAIEAQIEATTEVKAAIDESDKAQGERHKQLIKAIRQPSTAAGVGVGKHAEISSKRERGKVTSKDPKKSKKYAAKSSEGSGILSGVAGMLMGGAGAIGSLLMAAAPVIATIVAGAVALYAGKRSFDGYNDTEGQRKIFGLKDGEDPSKIQKIAVAAASSVVTVKEADAEVAKARKDMGLKDGEDASLIQKMAYVFGFKKQAVEDPTRHTINPDGTSQEKGKEPKTNIVKMILGAEEAFTKSITEMITGGKNLTENAGSNTKSLMTAIMGGSGAGGLEPSHMTDAMVSSHAGIGSLSKKYESGGDPGAVNNNDVGGSAYGTYQMHSSGTVGNFINNSKWAQDFAGLKPGSPEYGKKWKETAANGGQEFADAQDEFIKQTHYAPMVKRAEKMGIDVSSNKMLQNVLWSTGVQHGAAGGPEILSKALAGTDPKTLSPEEIKNRIYAERGRKDINGNLVHFQSVKGADAQQGISDRFVKESRDATAMSFMADNNVAPPKFAQSLEEQLLPSRYPSPIATSNPPPLPPPIPITPPKESPQQVVLMPGSGGAASSGGQSSLSGWQQPNFQPPSIDRRAPVRQQSQPQKSGTNIPMDFDDTLLTLLVHDLM